MTDAPEDHEILDEWIGDVCCFRPGGDLDFFEMEADIDGEWVKVAEVRKAILSTLPSYIRKDVSAAVLAEREICEKIARDVYEESVNLVVYSPSEHARNRESMANAAERIAIRIRARTEQEPGLRDLSAMGQAWDKEGGE